MARLPVSFYAQGAEVWVEVDGVGQRIAECFLEDQAGESIAAGIALMLNATSAGVIEVEERVQPDRHPVELVLGMKLVRA